MSILLIKVVTDSEGDSSWMIMPANSGSQYHFIGETLDDQANSIQLFATQMQDGLPVLSDSLNECIAMPNNPEGYGEVARELFSCEDIQYGTDLVYQSAAGTTLLDNLDDAGELLGAALV